MQETSKGLNTYRACYKRQKIEIRSDTSYHAQMRAQEIFKAKHSYDITIVLVALADGQEIVHIAVD